MDPRAFCGIHQCSSSRSHRPRFSPDARKCSVLLTCTTFAPIVVVSGLRLAMTREGHNIQSRSNYLRPPGSHSDRHPFVLAGTRVLGSRPPRATMAVQINSSQDESCSFAPKRLPQCEVRRSMRIFRPKPPPRSNGGPLRGIRMNVGGMGVIETDAGTKREWKLSRKSYTRGGVYGIRAVCLVAVEVSGANEGSYESQSGREVLVVKNRASKSGGWPARIVEGGNVRLGPMGLGPATVPRKNEENEENEYGANATVLLRRGDRLGRCWDAFVKARRREGVKALNERGSIPHMGDAGWGRHFQSGQLQGAWGLSARERGGRRRRCKRLAVQQHRSSTTTVILREDPPGGPIGDGFATSGWMYLGSFVASFVLGMYRTAGRSICGRPTTTGCGCLPARLHHSCRVGTEYLDCILG